MAGEEELVPRRDVLRHTVLVIDCGSALGLGTDYTPTRLAAVMMAAEDFIRHYYRYTPVAQLSLVLLRDCTAEIVQDPTFNPDAMLTSLRTHLSYRPPTSGFTSYSSGLQAASSLLQHTSEPVGADILIIASSPVTHDQVGLMDVVQDVVRSCYARVSVIQLGAATSALVAITRESHGSFAVPRDTDHLRRLAVEFAAPPLTSKATPPALIQVGFVRSVESAQTARLCQCHAALTTHPRRCPHCMAVVCTVPCLCPVCGLLLVSPAHLLVAATRVFPPRRLLSLSAEKGGDADITVGLEQLGQCRLCTAPLNGARICSGCGNVFCASCADAVANLTRCCPFCLAEAHARSPSGAPVVEEQGLVHPELIRPFNTSFSGDMTQDSVARASVAFDSLIVSLWRQIPVEDQVPSPSPTPPPAPRPTVRIEVPVRPSLAPMQTVQTRQHISRTADQMIEAYRVPTVGPDAIRFILSRKEDREVFEKIRTHLDNIALGMVARSAVQQQLCESQLLTDIDPNHRPKPTQKLLSFADDESSEIIVSDDATLPQTRLSIELCLPGVMPMSYLLADNSY